MTFLILFLLFWGIGMGYVSGKLDIDKSFTIDDMITILIWPLYFIRKF